MPLDEEGRQKYKIYKQANAHKMYNFIDKISIDGE